MPASSSRPLTIATAVPQEGINVLVVACSAGGGSVSSYCYCCDSMEVGFQSESKANAAA